MQEVSEALSIASDEVDEVTRSVDEMIADILEAGAHGSPKLADEDLGECLAQVLGRLSRAADARDIAISYALGHARQLRCERSKLERVLTNLVCNAVEAMQGQGRLWFHARDLQGRGGRPMVEVTVGNDNASIPPEELGQVFDPFFTAGKRNGTGLGLTIVKKIVQAHGGDIRCHSSAQTGVEFRFTVPASERCALGTALLPARMGGGARPGPPEPGDGAAPGGHIVLVEDSRAVRLAWRRRLPEHLLRAFESPAQCLAAAARDPALLTEALLVVLDNRFGPGEMDGVALGELLRSRTEAPLLLCSGVPLSPLPAWCDGQLAKDTYDLEALMASAQRARPRKDP